MHLRYLAATAVAALLALPAPAPLHAQSAAEHVTMGDAAYAALNPAEAVTHYEAAAAAGVGSYEAHWKAARSLVDLAEYERDEDKRADEYRRAEQHARKAVELNPRDAEAHFHLARVIGRLALTKGPKDKVKFGTEVRAQALEALKHDPNHPGALHVMGMWNAEIMRLNGLTRFVARNVLGGKTFDEASWDNAERYMRKAVEVDPNRITHRLDLAGVLADRGKTAEARQQYQAVIDGPMTDYNDRHYKDEARSRLKDLK